MKLPRPMQIETLRLLIRDLSPADVEHLAAMWSDPEVTHHSGGPRTRESVREAVQTVLKLPAAQRPQRWIVTLKKDGSFLGECGFIEKQINGNPEIELIYYFVKESW